MKIDDIQSEKIARIIIFDISNYILEHQEAYKKFLEKERKI